MMPSRYIDPTTDFGFKRLFGRRDSPESIEILKGFLYDVLELPYRIAELTFLPTEQVPEIATERTGIYDVYCTDTEGNHFLVEMQRNRQSYYKERALYYATFPITQQVRKGESGPPFKLLPIYVTSVLNFRMDKKPAYLRRVQLADSETGEVFYKGLMFVFIELPKFTKSLEELVTGTDRWLYLLRHMPEMQGVPQELQLSPYELTFKLAEEAALSSEEWFSYQGSLKQTLDEQGLYHTGRAEGEEIGRAKGRTEGEQIGRMSREREIAEALLREATDPATVARITGLSLDEVEQLRAGLSESRESS
jgi:predicted transposase/invertase (TIGR01784 family)